jgi:hypothetical protein
MLIYLTWQLKTQPSLYFGFNIYENFFLPQNVQRGSEAHPASYSKGEINLSPPSSAEVKNECSYILLPQYEFMARTWKTSALFRFVIRRPTVISSPVD